MEHFYSETGFWITRWNWTHLMVLGTCPTVPVIFLLSTFYCVLSTVYCLLSAVYCLLSTVYCLLKSGFGWSPHTMVKTTNQPFVSTLRDVLTDFKIGQGDKVILRACGIFNKGFWWKSTGKVLQNLNFKFNLIKHYNKITFQKKNIDHLKMAGPIILKMAPWEPL